MKTLIYHWMIGKKTKQGYLVWNIELVDSQICKHNNNNNIDIYVLNNDMLNVNVFIILPKLNQWFVILSIWLIVVHLIFERNIEPIDSIWLILVQNDIEQSFALILIDRHHLLFCFFFVLHQQMKGKNGQTNSWPKLSRWNHLLWNNLSRKKITIIVNK